MLRQEVRDYYAHFRVTPDLIELRNLVEVADLIIRSALSRHESRGLHYTLDYPEMLAQAKDTVLVPSESKSLSAPLSRATVSASRSRATVRCAGGMRGGVSVGFKHPVVVHVAPCFAVRWRHMSEQFESRAK